MTHNKARQRFEVESEGGEPAYLSYVFKDGGVVFDHTYVPGSLRGKGVASQLVRAALVEARQNNWRIVPECSYVAAFLDRHPEFSDLVATGEPSSPACFLHEFQDP